MPAIRPQEIGARQSVQPCAAPESRASGRRPTPIPITSASCLIAPSVLFIAFAIFETGVLASQWTSIHARPLFVQGVRCAGFFLGIFRCFLRRP